MATQDIEIMQSIVTALQEGVRAYNHPGTRRRQMIALINGELPSTPEDVWRLHGYKLAVKYAHPDLAKSAAVFYGSAKRKLK